MEALAFEKDILEELFLTCFHILIGMIYCLWDPERFKIRNSLPLFFWSKKELQSLNEEKAFQ